ncbi:MAG: hypothetical protein FWG44_05680 [Oscillospiraceae bacterium]|nr:hypothetical protein [Oscillospiraceae bacterium]
MRSSTHRLKDLTVFAMLGSLMCASQIAMQGLPNIHLLGLFIAAFTLTYRLKALIPLYVYIMLYGAFYGFNIWWLPYLYVWLPLWGMFMLAGRFNLPAKAKIPFYMFLCGLHGLAFGTLYAPFQALIFGLSFKSMIAWIIAGLPFDITHGFSNFCTGILILPLSELLKKLNKQM